MPRVERGAEVTLVVLTYRSLRWLEWCQGGVDASQNETRYRWLVVGCDAEEAVRPHVAVDFRNQNPQEWYIPRVYRAWNEGVLNAPTQLVVMLNSDMFASDHWLDQLLQTKYDKPQTVPTSLLVESGRLPSGIPEYVRDFGRTPERFDARAFLEYAEKIRRTYQVEPGRLYMPILVDRQEFTDVGGYPEGNPSGTTGDKDLIRRYAEAGFKHLTALGSVIYHCQLGEQEWPEKQMTLPLH